MEAIATLVDDVENAGESVTDGKVELTEPERKGDHG